MSGKDRAKISLPSVSAILSNATIVIDSISVDVGAEPWSQSRAIPVHSRNQTMAMKVSEIRRQKAARVSDVVGMRDAIREKFEVRMFADIETSPLDPKLSGSLLVPAARR